jgi:hypothetical protein
MANLQGTSIRATGTITSATASLLTLATACGTVVVSNRSGQTAYFIINDAASPIVSATVYDFALSDGQTFIIEWMTTKTIGVFVSATSGVVVAGWPS